MKKIRNWMAGAGISLALMGGAFSTAQAALVSWGSATNISGDSDVSTNGSLVSAFNFGSNTSVTVNGVVFAGMQIGAPQVVSVQIGGVHTLAINPERQDHTLKNFSTGSSVSPFTSLSVDYQTLLSSSAGSSFADRNNFLTLGGLTIGQSYEFQTWVNDATVSGCCSYGINFDGVDLDPNTLLDASFDVVAGGLGQFVIGTFFADAATQEFSYVRGEIEGGINGFQLRALTTPTTVPEPGSLFLVGVAALGLGWSRRRAKLS